MEFFSKLQDRQLVYNLKGAFTFKDNRQFLSALDQDGLSGVVLDFSHVDFIDSAALGMLILLHEEASGRKISLELRGATGQPLKMFNVSQFSTIFGNSLA